MPQPPDGPLADLIGADLVTRVARLACDCARILGDAAIEWAACDDGTLWLLQTQAVAARGRRVWAVPHRVLARGPGRPPPRPAGPAHAADPLGCWPTGR